MTSLGARVMVIRLTHGLASDSRCSAKAVEFHRDVGKCGT